MSSAASWARSSPFLCGSCRASRASLMAFPKGLFVAPALHHARGHGGLRPPAARARPQPGSAKALPRERPLQGHRGRGASRRPTHRRPPARHPHDAAEPHALRARRHALSLPRFCARHHSSGSSRFSASTSTWARSSTTRPSSSARTPPRARTSHLREALAVSLSVTVTMLALVIRLARRALARGRRRG